MKDALSEEEAHYQLGVIFERLCQYSAAMKHFELLLELANSRADKHQGTQAIYGIGRILHRQGCLEEAAEKKREALAASMEIGDQHLAAKILTSLGWTYSVLGMFDEQMDAVDRSIALSRKSGAIRNLAYGLSNAGAACIDKHNHERAMAYLKEALCLFERINEKRMIATVKLNISVVNVLQRDATRADANFADVVSLLRSLEDNHGLVNAYIKLGQANSMVGRDAAAGILFKKALQISEKNGLEEFRKLILCELQGSK